ncbi:hypothetical protein Q3O60_14920 [Alkalimonas collagenimarina]|uniref:YEATS-Like-Associating Three TM domain-containing protein n=1 Tax=Alkalimonas collagenimarina TaxID=400390 RepID=A0ABT9H2E1_9GAMM|nr:YEATS-associated helix-containing protein [Alkalimonas collagenimarina]MDP4537483.1 hypothetical protein [Alkalimonas collagenimarina]
MTHEVTVALIMAMTGILGGLANFLSDDNLKFEFRTVAKSIVLGVSASVMVPLFLSMISSNLLLESSKSTESYFILAGFCMVASIFSRSFINGVSSKILNDLKQKTESIDKKVDSYEEHVKPLIERSEEPEIDSNEAYDFKVERVKSKLNDRDIKILSAIDGSKYTIRTSGGIAQQLGMAVNSREIIGRRLREMKDITLVDEVKGIEPTSPKPRWYLTNLGRAVLRSLNNASDEKA